jgi:hypothetical protein
MHLENFHEYDNVKKVTFGKYEGGLFSKDVWYADVTLKFDDGTEHTVRWGLKDIKYITDSINKPNDEKKNQDKEMLKHLTYIKNGCHERDYIERHTMCDTFDGNCFECWIDKLKKECE